MLGIPKRTFVIVGAVLGVALIYSSGAEQRESEAEGAGGSGEQAACTVTVTADILNVRSGPGTGHDVVGKFREDAEVEATTEVRDGFRRVGDGRWASDEFLEPVDGARCE
ncbi:SH3 domain-containing protein [Saccharomonospora piscinae]|uniref:SH3 domain-containing protein n=1 Tax=Saccharomonospora piscinae TaxID=687388 RepID=UPI0004AEFAE9|nr:SH3 domain-containing protein [Saccharomonospora piscinae]